MEKMDLEIGDVVQLNDQVRNKAFVGALAMVDLPKSFGAQVGVNCLDRGTAYYRANFDEMEFIGKAPLVPSSEDNETHIGKAE